MAGREPRCRARWISRAAAAARTTSTWTGCGNGWHRISASRPSHAPVKRGGRFSVKALTPSAKSAEAPISCWILASNSSCSPIR
jgi:hypothetical protein